MTPEEMLKIQKYLCKLFDNQKITVKKGDGKDAPAEAYVGKEFVGVIYKDEDDGDISYDWNMSILCDDLQDL